MVGERLPTERLAQALTGQDEPVSTWNPVENGGAEGSSAGLAVALVALEGELEQSPATIVLLADDSDAALAGALVATKLLVPVVAAEAATAGEGVNARLISQLAAAYTAGR